MVAMHSLRHGVGLLALFTMASMSSFAGGECLLENEQVIRLVHTATVEHDVNAMFRLGDLFGQRAKLPSDYLLAIQWFRHAAERGNAEAMDRIGLLYARGNGVDPDFGMAMEWWLKAIQSGSAAGMGL